MAEKLVSAGVFTNENDQSFLQRGVSEIGGAFIGATPKGPAFVPTKLEKPSDFDLVFGTPSEDYYLPYTVRGYLQDAGVATVVRVLGLNGYTAGDHITINSASIDLATLRPTTGGGELFSASITGSGAKAINNFDLYISCSNETTTFVSLSLDDSDANYIGNIFTSSPTDTVKSLYVDAAYHSTISSSVSAPLATGSVLTSTGNNFTKDYDHGVTPWIMSQRFAGSAIDLFKFHTFSDGDASNTSVKAVIENVRIAGSIAGSSYGAFTVLIRKFSDTDARQEVYESFANVNLDPDSPDFITKRIGDKYTSVDSNGKVSYNGEYKNISKYIRVEMASNYKGFAVTTVPFGFQGYTKYSAEVPDAPTITSESTPKINLGIDFDNATDIGFYHKPFHESAVTGSDFMLEDNSLTTSDVATVLQFAVGFQNGFDGLDPTVAKNVGTDIVAGNVFGFDCSGATTSGSVSFRRAIDAVSNPFEFDINLLSIPGVNHRQHSAVTSYAYDMCEDRGDAFYIMDVGLQTDSIATVQSTVEQIDNNYVAVWYPWVKYKDVDNNKDVWVPPTVIMPRVIAYTDKVAHEWYVPAGLNRGGLPGVVEATTRLTKAEKDALYEHRINPIATYSDQGVVAWGNKNLQAKASLLDRINIRRLLIRLKKFVASTSRYLIFEQNNPATWQKFIDMVEPFLERVQQQSGLNAFRVVMDETTNTADVIDRNIMKGAIYIQPVPAAEFIVIDFNVVRTGAEFTV